MKSSTKNAPKSIRDIAYYRKRFQNRVFANLVAFITKESQAQQLTKKDIAERLKKDPAQLSRLLSQPSNLTLDTIADLLLAFDAEGEPPQIIKFSERRPQNYMHPLIARVIHVDGIKAKVAKPYVPMTSGEATKIVGDSGIKSKIVTQIELVAAE